MGNALKNFKLTLLLILGISTMIYAKGNPVLSGTWQYQGPEGTINLVFQSDNVLIFDGEPFQYSLITGIIRIQDEGETVDYPYAFQGENLLIKFPEGYQMQFVRVNRENSSPSPSVENYPGQGTVDSSELARQIAGIWWGYSGSTERKIGLCQGGAYQDYTESSYSGGSSDSLGNQTMAWGTAGQSGGTGTWRIQGNYQQGLIFVQYNNGSQITIRYQQCGETGCLLFNGNKLCRAGRCE